MSPQDLLAVAQDWLDQDPDPITRSELRELIKAKKTTVIRELFEGRIAFGTAGLRAALGPGPARMNRLVVTQTAAGIANWLMQNAESITPSVVIGYDARINSRAFAQDSAAVFSAAGVRALLFETAIATPILAYAVKQFGFSLGVMVTASHNPAKDNGYKVYLGGSHGGSQIVSPVDKQMAVAIAAVAKSQRYEQISRAEAYQVGGQDIIESYLATTAALVAPHTGPALKVVYTAMHGVGWATTKRLFAKVGLPEPIGVSQQLEPDGNFPTAPFPNPEEPGVLDLAFARATEVGADLVIAHDPDADRLAVGIATGTEPAFRRLTGDEVGLLIGHHLAEQAVAAGVKGTLATTVVSSSALAKVARKHRLKYVETLTGFKHLARVADLLFAYEEALGYSVNPSKVPDKDGISASLVFVSLANQLAANGISISKKLDELGKLYGYFETKQITVKVKKQADLTKLMNKLRQKPPTKIDKTEFELTDLLSAKGRLPKTDLLRFALADGRRIVIRPSGTEPKLKCYLQVQGETKESALFAMATLEAAAAKLLGTTAD